jgi:hypothetical protein
MLITFSIALPPLLWLAVSAPHSCLIVHYSTFVEGHILRFPKQIHLLSAFEAFLVRQLRACLEAISFGCFADPDNVLFSDWIVKSQMRYNGIKLLVQLNLTPLNAVLPSL